MVLDLLFAFAVNAFDLFCNLLKFIIVFTSRDHNNFWALPIILILWITHICLTFTVWIIMSENQGSASILRNYASKILHNI